MRATESVQSETARNFSRLFNESGYTMKKSRHLAASGGLTASLPAARKETLTISLLIPSSSSKSLAPSHRPPTASVKIANTSQHPQSNATSFSSWPAPQRLYSADAMGNGPVGYSSKTSFCPFPRSDSRSLSPSSTTRKPIWPYLLASPATL